MRSEAPPLTLTRMVVRSLTRRPVRTTLTALGVSVGVVAIVAFGTLVRGLWDAIDNTIHFNNSDMLIFQKDIAADIFSVIEERETRARLESLPEVEAAVGVLFHLQRVDAQPIFLTIGMRPADMGSRQTFLLEGRYPQTPTECLVGTIAKRTLEKGPGGDIYIRSEPFRVVGVIQSGIVMVDSAVILPLETEQRLAAKEGLVTAFQIFMREGNNPDPVARRIEAEFPELAAISDASQYKKIDQGLEVSRAMVWAVSFIAIVVGSIVVANTMWMVVLERTREIGVLRAIGWSRGRIVALIVLEATGVGLVSCVVGCVLGAGLAQLTTILPIAKHVVSPSYTPGPFVIALGIALTLSLIGAVAPAWRAARISPAEALRYE